MGRQLIPLGSMRLRAAATVSSPLGARARGGLAFHEGINPRLGGGPIHALLDPFVALPWGSGEASQDVWRTLFQPACPKKGERIPMP